MGGGSILFAFASTPEDFWPLVFPGMIISVTGLATAYVGANVTIMAGARKGEEVSRPAYVQLSIGQVTIPFNNTGRCGCLDEYCVPNRCDYRSGRYGLYFWFT